MFLGEIAALACAMCWAISGVMFKSQSEELDSLSINAIASSVAGIFFVGISLSSCWRADQLFHLKGLTILSLAGSVFISIVVGDTLYLKSLSWIGVSRALPLASIYPLFTAVLALFFLQEELSWTLAGGIILTMSGVYLVSVSQGGENPASFHTRERLAPTLALMAALCWATGTTVLKYGLKEADIFVANSVRMPLAALLLLAAARRWGHLRRARLKPVLIVLLAGLVGSCVGGVLFLFALQNAATARATTLVSTYPLAALPLAALFLKEKVVFRVVWGTLLAIGGIWLVMA